MQKLKKKIVALVPAAGLGKRINSFYPKQYLKIAGKTVIEHTLCFLLKQKKFSKIIISIRKNDNLFNKLKISKNDTIKTVIGGKRRADSVLSGLKYISNILKLKNCWVLIHDAVRPFLNQKDINTVFKFIEQNNFSHGGILATPVRDTIKRTSKKKIIYTIKRKELWHALTPQFFPLKLIKKCLIKSLKKEININDESSALEYCGYHPKLIQGKSSNFKITQPEDLKLAEFYFSKNFNV